MSIKLTSQVWEHAPVSGTLLLALLALADSANDYGITWPSVTTIAGKCRVSRRQAFRTLKMLESRGLLETRHRGSPNQGWGGVNQYRIRLENLQTSDAHVTSVAGVTSDAHVTSACPYTGDTHVTPLVTPMSPRTVIEPSEENTPPCSPPAGGTSDRQSETVEASPPELDPPALDTDHPPLGTMDDCPTSPAVDTTGPECPPPAPETAPPQAEQAPPPPASEAGEKPKRTTTRRVKIPCPEDFFPADRTIQLLTASGIPEGFWREQIGEFVLYWTSDRSNEKRPGWDATFLNRCKAQWARYGYAWRKQHEASEVEYRCSAGRKADAATRGLYIRLGLDPDTGESLDGKAGAGNGADERQDGGDFWPSVDRVYGR